jgi:CBS domain-containing protein
MKMANHAPTHSSQARTETTPTTIAWVGEQMVQTGHTMSAAIKAAAATHTTFMNMPALQHGLALWHQHMSDIAGSAAQANLRVVNQLLRLADPAELFALQQQITTVACDVVLTQTEAVRRMANIGIPPRTECVADVMSRSVGVVALDDSVQQVAKVMRENDLDTVVVAENDHIVGLITDHDVAVRLVAEARDPALTKVGEVMTPERRYVFEDAQLDQAATSMIEQQAASLPVVSRKKQIVGLVSLVDLAPPAHATEPPARRMNGALHKFAQPAPAAKALQR